MFCCFFSCEVPDHKPIPVQHPSPRSPRALGEVHLGVHHPFGHRALLHRVRLEADGAHMEPLGTAGARCSRLKLKLETDQLPFQSPTCLRDRADERHVHRPASAPRPHTPAPDSAGRSRTWLAGLHSPGQWLSIRATSYASTPVLLFNVHVLFYFYHAWLI